MRNISATKPNNRRADSRPQISSEGSVIRVAAYCHAWRNGLTSCSGAGLQWRLSDGGLWMRAKSDRAMYWLACFVRGRVSAEAQRASGKSRKSGLRRRVIAVSDGRSGQAATCPEAPIPAMAAVLSQLGSITVVKAKHVDQPRMRPRSGCFHGR